MNHKNQLLVEFERPDGSTIMVQGHKKFPKWYGWGQNIAQARPVGWRLEISHILHETLGDRVTEFWAEDLARLNTAICDAEDRLGMHQFNGLLMYGNDPGPGLDEYMADLDTAFKRHCYWLMLRFRTAPLEAF